MHLLCACGNITIHLSVLNSEHVKDDSVFRGFGEFEYLQRGRIGVGIVIVRLSPRLALCFWYLVRQQYDGLTKTATIKQEDYSWNAICCVKCDRFIVATLPAPSDAALVSNAVMVRLSPNPIFVIFATRLLFFLRTLMSFALTQIFPWPFNWNFPLMLLSPWSQVVRTTLKSNS